MNKASKRMIFAGSIALAGVMWLAAVVSFTMFLDLEWLCWGSVVFNFIAIIISEFYILVFRRNIAQAGAENSSLGIIATVAYLSVSFFVNTLFILLSFGHFNWILFALNTIAGITYIVVLLWTENHTARLSLQLEKTEQRIIPTKDISRKLGELLAITVDEEIRSRLLRLKEAVDYGTNISLSSTADRELQMGEKLDEIAQLVIGHANSIIIINKISEAEMIWKMRSSTASSMR